MEDAHDRLKSSRRSSVLVTSRADARLFDDRDSTVKLANYIKIVIAA